MTSDILQLDVVICAIPSEVWSCNCAEAFVVHEECSRVSYINKFERRHTPRRRHALVYKCERTMESIESRVVKRYGLVGTLMSALEECATMLATLMLQRQTPLVVVVGHD